MWYLSSSSYFKNVLKIMKTLKYTFGIAWKPPTYSSSRPVLSVKLAPVTYPGSQQGTAGPRLTLVWNLAPCGISSALGYTRWPLLWDSSILCLVGILPNKPDFTVVSFLLILLAGPFCFSLDYKNLSWNEISKLEFLKKIDILCFKSTLFLVLSILTKFV